MLHAPIPEKLLPLKEKIKKNLIYSGFRSSNEKNTAQLTKSLYGKRNTTVSKFIKDIYDLHSEVKSFIDYPEQQTPQTLYNNSALIEFVKKN